jgi:prevent-host-death family protein
MPDGTWSLAEAKAKLSEVVERARTEGPQHLTKNGKDAVVVVSAEDYQQLTRWRDRLIIVLGPRLLPVDAEVALAQARIRRESENARRTIPVMDAFLAATAEVHALTLVTRNVRDFEAWGGPVFNPWGD